MISKAKILLFILLLVQFTISAQKQPIGLWRFDNSTTLTKADFGNDLKLFGSASYINGPGNGAVRVGKGSYLILKHGITPKNQAYYVNEYTLQIDFRVPTLSVWHSLFQTSPTNSNDAECFISLNGNIGVEATGYSSYSIKPNEWYRLVVSVKNGVNYDYYLDGFQLHNGIVQVLHGRFALDKELLLFADNNGEDGEIDCAEVAIWDYSLNADEVKSLGGYGHKINEPSANQLILVPYLQTATSNSVYVSWHDPLDYFTKVEYGTTNSLGEQTTGSSEAIYRDYRWHTVKLENLSPDTEYFYKAVSPSGASKIFSFRTQPSSEHKGKLRFLLLSDTHANDTTMAGKLLQQAKKQIQKLYGDDFQNHINMVLHSGDLVMNGNDITQWTKQYFALMSSFSSSLAIMTVPGNHEGENRNYYSYMKYDDFSPIEDDMKERVWTFNLANTAIVGLNSNLHNINAVRQIEWLNQKLLELENNPQIDFIFLLVHHLPISELWGEGMSDVGSKYVNYQILPILKKYSKVVQLSYGHTHGFERGTIETEAANPTNDFRIVCGGGGGGDLDRWGSFRNLDYKNIHLAFDHYSFQIIEIDAANKTFESQMYSLGNESSPRDCELLDSWYIKLNQHAPEKPIAFKPAVNFNKITFNTSPISEDSIMSVRIQVSENSTFLNNSIDETFHWKNVFGVDSKMNPVDHNKNVDLRKLSFRRNLFGKEGNYYYRVKYRDHNLKWSEWSNTVQFQVTAENYNDELIDSVILEQNFPNPYNSTTKIIYRIMERNFVTLKVYDILGSEISTLVNKEMDAGEYEAEFDGKNLSSGVYFYKLQAGNYSKTKKLTLVR
ncbi:MAG: metallophosphoesterase [Ignavibacteria bacterium]|nr:MAG: metallophosphoesterase [Ignavibacteria bacterium]KAF0157951.1 MAG: metallophosphoesterase [Ignavibacteria bacterium]